MSKKLPENQSLLHNRDSIENDSSSLSSDNAAELPSYSSAIASSSQHNAQSFGGKSLPQHSILSNTSDNDCRSLPMPLPSFDSQPSHSIQHMPSPGFNLPPQSGQYMPLPSFDPQPQRYPPFSPTAENDGTLQVESLAHSAIEMEQHENPASENDQYRARPAPPGYSIYQAESKTSKDGNITSRDKHINEDREALSQFMYRNNTPPVLIASFCGYHEETYYVTRVERNSDGENVNVREPQTKKVEDFSFRVDLCEYISPTCRGVYALPDSRTNEAKTVSGLCEDYIKSLSILKELRLTKEVTWDFDRVITAMTNAIQSTNSCETVEIKFITKKDRVAVKSNHWYSQLMDNNFFTFFMVISCLWIFILPFNYLYKRKHSRLRIKSEWNMRIPEQVWYETHAREIMTMCINKTMRDDNPLKLITQIQPMPGPSSSMNAPQGPWF